jgi:hypothetical protein
MSKYHRSTTGAVEGSSQVRELSEEALNTETGGIPRIGEIMQQE